MVPWAFKDFLLRLALGEYGPELLVVQMARREPVVALACLRQTRRNEGISESECSVAGHR